MQYHIKCDRGDVARYVLLPGDPARVKVIASLWDESRKVAENREYVTYTGKTKGVEISTTSTGIGGPSVAIAVEELARCGADTFIRVGTCGGTRVTQNIGDVAIATGAVRWEGTSRQYVVPEYPAFSAPEVVLALIEAAELTAVNYHGGITRTSDNFYSNMGFGGYTQSWMEDIDKDFLRANVMSAEMEAATMLTLANLYGLRAGCICSIIDLIPSVERSDVETKVLPVEEALQPKPEFIRAACECAVKGVQVLNKWDSDREAKGKKNWYPSLSYGRVGLDADKHPS